MKHLLISSLVLSCCVSAFAQGKVLIGNDSAHLLNMGQASLLKPADQSYAGMPAPWYPSGALPGGSTFVVGLYGGPSAAGLTLVTTYPNDMPVDVGRLENFLTTLPAGFPPGVDTYFQIKVWETGYSSYEAAQTAGIMNPFTIYGAQSSQFYGLPGSFSFPPLSGPLFNWQPGDDAWLDGGIILFVPEPSSATLAGLGMAVLLIFRRRR